MSRFEKLLSRLPEGGERDRILSALDRSTISSEKALRAIVQGRNIEQVTSLFKEELHLNGFDASALAGLLVVPQGNPSLLSLKFSFPRFLICVFLLTPVIHAPAEGIIVIFILV